MEKPTNYDKWEKIKDESEIVERLEKWKDIGMAEDEIFECWDYYNLELENCF